MKMAEFIDLAKRYTDFSELTAPMMVLWLEGNTSIDFMKKITMFYGK